MQVRVATIPAARRRTVSGEAALNKAPDAFRTISEVAEELDLPQHVLRFWESRFPHIKPLKRGGGRRYYRPEDVDLLRGIRRLLYSDGYTIKGVQRILRERGMRTVQSVGQGLDVANLTAPARNPALEDDASAGADRRRAGEFTTAADDVHQPDDAEHDGEAPRQILAMARSAPLPTIGPLTEVGMGSIARVAKVEATSERAMAGPVAAMAATVTPVAAPLRTGLAVRDVDRLKKALADLEACRRLLDKAVDGQ
jgi:DNA-binding transcriptional MerR regulator